jgi:HK97 family phage major capsid protein
MADEVKAVIDSLQKTFADFKAEHTEQLAEIKRGNADVVKAEKVDRINAELGKMQAAVDEANAKIAALSLGGVSAGNGPKDREYTDAFRAHFKKGDVSASLNKGTASEGGYLAPVEWDRTITDRLVQVSPMRSICAVQNISTAGFKKLFNNRGATSGWVGETASRTETATPTFGELTYTPGEIYANPSATQQMLDDAEVNLEAWLANEVMTEFAYQEGVAFLTGNGTNRPQGILNYVTGGSAATAHPWGAIGVVNSGSAAALTADGLVNLVYALKSEFTGGARFIMNRDTQNQARLLKDGQGNYLWQPTYVAGQPGSILGYPITEMPGMPNVEADETPVLFGNFAQGYLIIDRVGVRVLRDPFTNKPYVMFYTTKRVGGGLLNPDVIKALVVSA